tara:strand:+ start:98 stop:814 length:717 start_codon:yes stop_codon:yes gene_type:complete
MKTRKPLALVTGSSSGIGLAISKMLEETGYEVIKHGKKKRNNKNGYYISADLTSETGVKKIISYVKKRFNKLDLLVNNASYTKYIPYSNFRRLNKNLIQKIMFINFHTPYLLSTNLLNLLKNSHEKTSESQIINIASAAGITGSGSNLIYSSAKGALITFTKSFAKTIAPIRVNSISPGLIKTNFVKFPKKYYIEMKKKTPVGKVGLPNDIANVVNFLLKNNYITGQNIIIDGGRMLK